MTQWFGLFSSGPRCANPECGAEVSPAEQAAYSTSTPHGPRYLCEDCWAKRQPQADRTAATSRLRVRRDPRPGVRSDAV